MATFRQDYRATETVYNVHQMAVLDDLGLHAAAATHLPQKVTIVATLINRDPQYEALIGFLEERLASTECRRPALIVMQGRDAELHRAFVLRCEQLDLPELLGSGETCDPIGRVRWPESSSRLDSILRSLNEPFRLRRLAPRAELEAKLRELPQSVCFSHHVDAARWDEGTARLIDQWIDFVRNDWPELPPGRLAVAFLCIELPAEASVASAAARDYVQALSRRYAADPCVLITSELQPIRPKHIGDWIADARRHLGDEWDETVIVDAPRRLFAEGQQARPLAELFHDLLELLREAYRPVRGVRPIFKE